MSNINWYKYTILFFYPTPPKVLRKRRKEEEEKKEIWMFSKSLDLDGNKITNSIHWYAPKKQNELPNMEDALISNFHTHTNCIIIQYFWLFYYQFSIQIFIDFYYTHTYYLQKASPDHIIRILVQLLLTVSNPKIWPI